MKTPAHVRLLQEELKQTKCRLAECQEGGAPASGLQVEIASWGSSPSTISDPTSFPLVLGAQAANQYSHALGSIYIPSGGSKTLSAAGGGAIYLYTGGCTFLNGASSFRVGASTPGLYNAWDGSTFDVYGEITPATHPSPGINNKALEIPMTSGSKTIANGDILSVVFGQPTHGGTDIVRIHASYSNYITELPTVRDGTGTGSGDRIPIVVIRFDDGTYGTFYGGFIAPFNAVALDTADNPNEYAMLYTPASDLTISGFFFYLAGNNLISELYEFNIYQNPTTSPVSIYAHTKAFSAYEQNLGYLFVYLRLPSPLTLTAGTQYGFAVSAPATGEIYLATMNTTGLPSAAMEVSPFGATSYGAGRVRGVGTPFVANPQYPLFGLQLSI